jgi:hypothetical protein
MLPHGYLGRCETFMTQYGDRAVEMILVEGSSHGICIGLGLCFMIDTKVAPLPDTLYTPQVMINNGGGSESSKGKYEPKCVLCEYVISTLALKIKNNATEVRIIYVKRKFLSLFLFIYFSARNQSGSGTDLH